MKKILFLVLLFTSCASSNKALKVEADLEKKRKAIIQKSKAEILQLALAEIKPKYKVDLSDYKTKVVYNDNEVWVSFYNPIKYVPLNSDYIYDINVALISKQDTYQSIGNPPSSDLNSIQLFNYKDKSYQKHIDFVLDAIDKSDEIASVGNLETFEGALEIKDKGTHYEVRQVGEESQSSYRIKKESGEIYDTSHEDFPYSLKELKKQFTEIKD